jgi:hypothetical protein
LKDLLKALKSLDIEESTWQLKQTGLWFHSYDPSHTTSFGAFLPKSEFGEYDFKEEFSLTIPVDKLNQLTSSMKSDVIAVLDEKKIVIADALRVISVAPLNPEESIQLDEELKAEPPLARLKLDLEELAGAVESALKITKNRVNFLFDGKLKVFSLSDERDASSYSAIKPFGFESNDQVAASFNNVVANLIKSLQAFGGIGIVRLCTNFIHIKVPCLGGRRVWGYLTSLSE